MDIRILPSNLANMIAAGEVVQRPASVVKELVENAVDAGATQVTVIIQDAGRTLIQVVDNGCGMSPDEAVLCFERHATSKLHTAEDLHNIISFGFRGEALASIAAVAEVTLKTRREEDETGCQVEFAESHHIATDQVSAPKGSSFSVRNLFYNIPARRKFLKSDSVEFKHIVTEFVRVALTRPEIGFTLTHNGKDVYVLRPAKSLKFRIQDALGSNVAKEIVDVQAKTSVVTIEGFVGRPESAKKGLGNQYFFVNGRYFRSPYLHKAVLKAYENLVPDGVTPSYFLYLNVDPQAVDVNIHPTKTEIKFEDDSVVFQIVYACIKETLGKNSFGNTIDFERQDIPELPMVSHNFDEFRHVSNPSTGADLTFNPFENDGFPSEQSPYMNSFGGESSDRTLYRESYGKLFEDRLSPAKMVMVVQDKYIITTSRSGLMVVNIQRAMERIMYDRFLVALSKNEHVTQTTLFPVAVPVGVENMHVFEEHSELLSSLGFDIAPFGNDTIVVNGVPEGYGAEADKVQSMIGDLVLVLSEDHSALSEMLVSNMASRLARLGAFNREPVRNQTEAQAILDDLFSSDNAEYTSSGKKIVNILPMEDLDKMF